MRWLLIVLGLIAAYWIGILHQCARESARRSWMRRQVIVMREKLEALYNQDLA